MPKRRLSVLIFLLLAGAAAAQPPHTFTRYGRENNFTGSTVEDMAQDSYGQLWLATWGGLYSFDGRTFQNYLTGNPADRDNPRSNHFLDVEILESGEILAVSYDNRLYRLNPETRTLELPDPRGQNIQAMFRPSQDELYFLTTDGEMLDASFSSFCRIRSDATVRAMISRRDEQAWILTDRGIYRGKRLAGDSPAFCVEEVEGNLYIGSSGGELLCYQAGQLSSIPTQLGADVTFIAQVPDRPELLLGTDAGKFELYGLDDGTRRPIALQDGSPGEGSFAALKDKEGNLWVYSTRGSLNWYDPQAHRLIPFLDRNRQQDWNSETGITSLLSDRQGNLWIGSTWGGLERVVFHADHFRLRTFDESRQISPENSVRALLQDESGWIFAATRDSRLHLLDETLRERAAWMLERPAFALARSHDGTIWAGTRGAGLVEMTLLSNEQFRYNQISHPRDELFYGPSSNNIWSLLEDASHRLWMGTYDDGVSYLDLDAGDRPFISKKNRLSFPTDRRNRIRCLALSPDGRLYAGGQMGLFVCNQPAGEPEEMHFERFSQILDYDIQHILFTREGELYVCSFGAGLLRFESGEPDSGFQAWTANDGLLSNYTLSAVEDASGNLWIATQAGLNRFNPQTGSLIGYPHDRLGHELRFNEGKPLKALDGTLYFNTSAGLFYFNPEEISNDGFVPELLVQAFYVAGERRDVDEDTPIVILPTDGIRVQVAAADLTAPEQVLYSYKLDGADGDWVHLGHQASVSIPPQHPGRYTLRIRSTNGDGLAIDNERAFTIIVRRHFFQSIWAGLLYMAIAGAIAFLLTRPRRHARKDGAEAEKEPEDDPLLRGLHGDDRRFVESFTRLLENRLDDGSLDVTQICNELNVSRSVLFSKCRTLLGTTPATFLRRLRLERAQTLIREGGRTMADISYAVGFNDPHYFSKIFRQEFGMTPKDYRDNCRKEISQP